MNKVCIKCKKRPRIKDKRFPRAKLCATCSLKALFNFTKGNSEKGT